MHISPLECWTPKPLFSPPESTLYLTKPYLATVLHSFSHSGLVKENKTKHQTLQQFDGDGNDGAFGAEWADSKFFQSWGLGTHFPSLSL